MNLDQLNTNYGIADQLQFVDGKGGLPLITIANPLAKATISLYAGQVLSFQPSGEPDDLLFVSDSAYYQTGKAIKGGIPICWPWFGPDPDGQGRPSHGFVRNRPWNILGTATTAEGATQVTLGLTATPETQGIWPYAFELAIEITVGTTLTVALITRNTGEQPFTITQALHTYFKIGDVHKVSVLGLENANYLDKVDGGIEKAQIGAVAITDEVDRIYTNLNPDQPLVIADLALGRQIHITATGSKTAVVWNPWAKIAAAMADLADDDYLRMLCVETANAADEIVTVPAGDEFRLAATYRIERSA